MAADGTTVGGVGFLAVAPWQARMVRGAGVWVLARRTADGGRRLLCAGHATEALGLAAERDPAWNSALAAGADEFLFVLVGPKARAAAPRPDRLAA